MLALWSSFWVRRGSGLFQKETRVFHWLWMGFDNRCLNHEKYGNTIKWRFVDDRSPDTWGIISIHSGNPFWQTSTTERRNRLNTAQIGPRNPPIQTTQGLVGSLKINGWCIAHCCRFGPQCRWWKVPFVKAVWLGLLADNCFFWDSPFLSVNHILW
jgi:hypothetical protein